MSAVYKKEIKVRLPVHIAEPFTRVCHNNHVYPATGLIMLAHALASGRVKFSELLAPQPRKPEVPKGPIRRGDRLPTTSKPKGDPRAQRTAKAQKNR